MCIYLVPKVIEARSSQDSVHRPSGSLGGVQTSDVVENIEALAAQSMYSQGSAPPTIAIRQGRGHVRNSQIEDTSNFFNSSSQLSRDSILVLRVESIHLV
jgi:hypothetical protein